MIETVLCVDIGTTSLKAGLISASGEVVSFSKYTFLDYDNRMIAHKWLGALSQCVSKIKKNLKSQDVKIKAISISGNGPTIVSKSGMTLRWNEDYVVNKNITGPSLFLPRIIAFKELFPKEYNRSNYLFSGPEYLIYELTNRAVTVLPEKRYINAYWTDESLEKAGIDSKKMPEYVEIGQLIGNLTDEAEKILKFETLCDGNIPVFSCGPDFIAALVGTGTLSPGKICDRSGSSEGFNFCIDKAIPCEGLRLLPSVISGLWNISALLTMSSKLSEKQRLTKVTECVNKLRKFADDNGFDFPDSMTVTGGQTMNKNWMKKKAETLGMTLKVCKCSNSELIGNACAAWFGLGKYKTLQEAAENIVIEE